MKREIRNIISVLLLALFVGNYVYTSAFMHTHFVENDAVTHAHPFSGSHNHSSSEYQLLNAVFTAAFISTQNVSVNTVFRPLNGVLENAVVFYNNAVTVTLSSPRAPPVLS